MFSYKGFEKKTQTSLESKETNTDFLTIKIFINMIESFYSSHIISG